MIRLSILIPSLGKRKEQLTQLLEYLNAQMVDGVEVITLIDDGEITIGKKRNQLVDMASGEFIVMVDDDDSVSDDYIPLIVSAIGDDIDCVGMQGIITTDGKDERQWFISKDYKNWHESNGVYYRTPNHISPIRRSLARQVKFRDIKHAEDFYFSMEVLPLLKNERKIEKNIYHYKFMNK